MADVVISEITLAFIVISIASTYIVMADIFVADICFVIDFIITDSADLIITDSAYTDQPLTLKADNQHAPTPSSSLPPALPQSHSLPLNGRN